jgi:hypothetical protein
MPQLNAAISPGLWRALLDYAERTKEPLAHIVSGFVNPEVHGG